MEDFEKKYKDLLQAYLEAQEEITELHDQVESLKCELQDTVAADRNIIIKTRQEMQLYKDRDNIFWKHHKMIKQYEEELHHSIQTVMNDYYKWRSDWNGEDDSVQINEDVKP